MTRPPLSMSERQPRMTVDRELRIAETFVELADTLVADFDVIEFLQLVSTRCVELVDVAATGVMLADPGGALMAMAASDERARLLELFEMQNDEGPCRDCYQHSDAVVNIDLAAAASAGRWPHFAPRAIEEGFRWANALPLRLRDQVIGALNLFDPAAGGLSADQLRLAQALADAATIGILQQRSVRQSEVVARQLQVALTSRIVIEQAKGVLAERLQISVDTAFAILREGARSRNMLLSDVAREVTSSNASASDLARLLGPAVADLHGPG
jgi:transcriptional regulator with GAF, ATPase, and Fis domain